MVTISTLLLLPRLGLWSRDKTAKGTTAGARAAVGRIDAATEAEVVGGANVCGPSRPVLTVLASEVKLISIARIDNPAPHKEEWT